jgi:hypothetical protein
MASPQPVHSVETVSIEIIKSHPPQLQIIAEGTVPSTGFTDAMLDETIYIDPPADGVYEYSFVATPPEEASAPLMTPIRAETLRFPLPNGLKGVSVRSETNITLAMLEVEVEVEEPAVEAAV